MTIDYEEILTLVCNVAQDKNIQVALKEVGLGSLLAGVTTGVGGLLLGPIGMAIGGAVGGVAAAVMSEEKFKSVPQVIMQDMSETDRRHLANNVKKIIKNIDTYDLMTLTALIYSNGNIEKAIINEVVRFISQDSRFKVVQDSNF